MFTTSLQIYYEDTDLSGSVYHANYLRYFERAREHLLGPPELVRLWKDEGIGFVVYKWSIIDDLFTPFTKRDQVSKLIN